MKPWEIFDGTYPPRVLLAYIRTLPAGSATNSALQGNQALRGWDTHTYMLANLFDAIQYNTYAVVASNSRRKPPKPEPLQRPDVKSSQKKKEPDGGLFALMARQAFYAGRKKED